jgi:hypothetical protein
VAVRYAVLIGCLTAAPAYADHSSLHATATGDVAATDNVFATPHDQAQGDLFTQVRPGVLFAYDAPRMIHELIGEVELLEYALHSDKPSVTVRGGWRGFFLPGPRSQVTVNVNASNGQLNALTSRTSPEQTTVGVTPTGAIDTIQTDAGEFLSYVISKEFRFSQAAYGRWTGTDDNNPMGATTTSSAEGGATLGLERTFRSDSIGIEGGGSVLRLERIAPMGAIPPSRLDQQLNPRAVLVWRHDINKEWSTNIDGGLVYVHPFGTDPYNPTDVRRSGAFPVVGGLVAYTEMWGRLTASVRRTVAPNLLIAMNTVDDQALAQIALPLPWLDENPHLRLPKLLGLASLGIERTQLVDPMTSKLEGDYQVGRVDVGVSYTVRPGQTYGLRYELVYQHASSIANSILPNAPSYFRNTLYFTFSLRYPDRVAAQIPRRSESVRADRKDLSPVGAEPVVPDPTEAVPDDDSSNHDSR